jgi:microsomal epoxide hydrolase
MPIEPFTIDVPQSVLDDLHQRLDRTIWPEQVEGAEWDYGTELVYLQELCRYWRHEYDWRAAEARLNAFPQFLSTVDGEQIHFIHVRSPHPGAVPLVVTHGWPGSVVEFLEVIGPLVDPPAHGGDAADAFHVVCPSIPGYAWSGPTHQRGWHIGRVGDAIVELMGQLGYDRFGAQGGDWGALATCQMAARHADRLIGIHLNLPIAPPPTGADPLEGLSPEELAGLGVGGEFQKNETGYSAIQGSKPQTLSYGLTDSPAGLAGWIVEKFRTWSDCDGDVERTFTRDALLTNISAYWLTRTAGSSARLYYESAKAGLFGVPVEPVKVPTGMAVFPKEIAQMPRRWVEAAYDLRQWTVMPKGGHFAAMEQPELFVDDVRTFFRQVRPPAA